MADLMKLYEIEINPLGLFGTPLKGDTIFGHFCWQVAYDSSLVEGGICSLQSYEREPFAVFSSAVIKLREEGSEGYILKRPALPLGMLFSQPAGCKSGENEDKVLKKALAQRKLLKKKRWLKIGSDLTVSMAEKNLLNDEEVVNLLSVQSDDKFRQKTGRLSGKGSIVCEFEQFHNTVSRLTWTTGEEGFAPFSMLSHSYLPGLTLALFVLVDPNRTSLSNVRRGLERIGVSGYGRDASSGLGRFEVVSEKELTLPSLKDFNAFFTVAPSVPQKEVFSKFYYEPFIRYGRHGDTQALSSNPFKEPILMADEGAVFLKDRSQPYEKSYLGRAVTNISKAQPETVAQGYSWYIPFNLDIKEDF